ncbi:hypothetical protein DVR12_01920 [Chitinophaga silvatica]|uniref:Uncharacterized protein n=1 Tax=Chitinophaga silvatica TaxID=2282649 RepID=A0A3E1YGS4_9BACT|nr:hypothetical protein DVR12_01920 [Chitinophaga silvatica]
MYLDKRNFQLIPFISIIIMVIITWYSFFLNEVSPIVKHKIALALIIVNLIIYFVNSRIAIACTGLILILLILNFISVTYETNTLSFFLTLGKLEISTPDIQWIPFLVLVVYLILNFKVVKSFFK